MNVEQLQKMNDIIETTKIEGKDYAMVHERIKALRSELPSATIETDIVHIDGSQIIIKATVKDEYDRVLGTGHAEERQGNGNINQTSYVENCETSAVGRALGMCGIGIDKSFASADEVANAIYQQKNEPDKIAKIKELCKKDKVDLGYICQAYKVLVPDELTAAQQGAILASWSTVRDSYKKNVQS